jgi:hypothetical protein
VTRRHPPRDRRQHRDPQRHRLPGQGPGKTAEPMA